MPGKKKLTTENIKATNSQLSMNQGTVNYYYSEKECNAIYGKLNQLKDVVIEGVAITHEFKVELIHFRSELTAEFRNNPACDAIYLKLQKLFIRSDNNLKKGQKLLNEAVRIIERNKKKNPKTS